MRMKPATSSLDTIFADAIAIEQPDARANYLDVACGPDLALRGQVEKLVSDYFRAGDFLEEATDVWGNTPQTNSDAIGQHVGNYCLVEQIGEGGMGIVFVAEQREPVRRRVALKVIKPGMDTRQVIARFEIERQILAILEHPNIARVLDGGTTDQGRPYFVMELVKGIPITAYCQQAKISLTERLKLFATVCQAVQHAHQKGIIHRDIKPSNVMVTMLDGQAMVKVIDFGIAKIVQLGLGESAAQTGFSQLVGTPMYMSPEQAALSAVDVDTRSDVYSLGVLLYELLTGTTPFDNDTLAKSGWDEMQRMIREVDPPKPSQRLSTLSAAAGSTITAAGEIDLRQAQRQLRGELDWIVFKAIDKDRARRYQSPAELAADIDRYLAREPVLASPPSKWYRLSKYARRHTAALGSTAVVVASLLVGTGISVWQTLEAEKARELAEQRLDREQKARAEKAEALAIATAVSDFIKFDLLGLANPENQRAAGLPPDPDIKLRTVVDRAAERIDKQFAGQPRVEASLRATLGQVFESLGETKKAYAQFERACDLFRESGREDHKLLYSMMALGQLRLNLGDFAGSRKTLEDVFDRATQLLGSDHRVTLETARHLKTAYELHGDFAKAESLATKSYEISLRTYGPDDDWTLAAKAELGSVYLRQGDYAKALPFCDEVVAAWRRKKGEQSHPTLNATSTLASVHFALGNYAKAKDLYARCVEVSRRLLGADHYHTIDDMHNLANAYTVLQDFSNAERLYLEVLEKRRRVLGREHPDTLRTITGLFGLYDIIGVPEKAEPLLREVLEIRERTQPGQWRTFETRSMLGGTLLAQGKLDEAEPLLLSGYEGFQRQRHLIPANRKNRLPDAIERVVKLYEAKKDTEQAAQWREKLNAARAELQKSTLKPSDSPGS